MSEIKQEKFTFGRWAGKAEVDDWISSFLKRGGEGVSRYEMRRFVREVPRGMNVILTYEEIRSDNAQPEAHRHG